MKKNNNLKEKKYAKIEVYSEHFKELIIGYGKVCGMDVDGDIVYYNNKKYFVHAMHNIVAELVPINSKENIYNIVKLICLYIAYICSAGMTFIFLEVISLTLHANLDCSLFDILTFLTVLLVSYLICYSYDNEFIDKRLYPVYIFPNYKNAKKRASISVGLICIFTILKKIAWAAVIASCILGFFFINPNYPVTLYVIPICGTILRISYILCDISFQFMPNSIDLDPDYEFRYLIDSVYKS